jgi:hypothetical protein
MVQGDPSFNSSAKELEALWDGLSSKDAKHAFKAILRLEALPDTAPRFLLTKLTSGPALTPDVVEKLIEDLGDKRFSRRQEVQSRLRASGVRVENDLIKARDGKKDLEMMRRLELLISDVRQEKLRVFRAMEALERIGGQEVRRTLLLIAAKNSGSEIGREARETLERLDKKSR